MENTNGYLSDPDESRTLGSLGRKGEFEKLLDFRREVCKALELPYGSSVKDVLVALQGRTRNATDEPLFTLRANDALAPGAIRSWILRAQSLGVNKEKLDGARRILEAMEAWPNRRLPD